MNYLLLSKAQPPTPTLDLPDLNSGVWAASPAACFFTSTIEAFDDLNLQFGSRPSPLALPPLTMSISSQPTLPPAIVISGGKTKLLPFSARCPHMPPRRQPFSHWPAPTFLLPGFLFLSLVPEHNHESMLRFDYTHLPQLRPVIS